VFLLNAAILFSGVVAFIIAGFAGTFVRSLHPWRYRMMLAPLGFVVCGGISISAEQHLLRWIEHGHLQHSLSAGIAQSVVLIIAGLCGLLAGLGLGSSLDRSFPDEHSYSIANYWTPRESKSRDRNAKIVPISSGRQPGVAPQIKAISHRE
jgi:hypothetical protein